MTRHKCLIFSFADIEVREREFSLARDGEVLAVEPKAFRVLLFLLRNPHKLITKEELLDAVWGDIAVSENSLTRSIALLRKVLDDDTHEPRYIATVPTVGYRFLCDVKVTEDGFAEPGAAEISSQPVQAADTAAKTKTRFPTSKLKSRPLIVAGIGLAVLAAVLIGFFAYRAPNSRASGLAKAGLSRNTSRMRVTQLTSLPGDYSYPAFSPSGEHIAYIWDGENPVRGDLYVQLVGGERPLRLTHTKSGFVCCVSWSPNGREITFGRCDDHGGAVYIVPALGGTERKVTDVLCPYGNAGYPQWTADGRSLVLADSCVPNGRLGIVVFSLQTGERRCLHTPPPGDVGDVFPVLSPDRQTIAFLRGPTVGLHELYTVSISGSNLRQLTFDDESHWNPMWSADGKYIAFESSNGQIYRVSAIGGTVEREMVFPYSGSLSRDGRRLARAERGRWPPQVWRVQLASPGSRGDSQTKILVSTGANDGAQLSSDEQQITFQSDRSGSNPQIWK